jgi:predicted SAM-dependent methyltransferase
MIKNIKRFLVYFHIFILTKELITITRLCFNKVTRLFGLMDYLIKAKYFKNNNIRKLHIGCGSNILKGWLNSDWIPNSSKVLSLDATHKFSIKSDEFNYIFCEHMIACFSYFKGEHMLKECYRILKQNGTIRVSTSDLTFLIELFNTNKSSLQKKYIEWSCSKHVEYAPYYDEAFVINNFVREWGNQFIYNENTLRQLMKNVGFKNITKCNLSESKHEPLSNLENDQRMPDGFLNLETIILEGTK